MPMINNNVRYLPTSYIGLSYNLSVCLGNNGHNSQGIVTKQ